MNLSCFTLTKEIIECGSDRCHFVCGGLAFLHIACLKKKMNEVWEIRKLTPNYSNCSN